MAVFRTLFTNKNGGGGGEGRKGAASHPEGVQQGCEDKGLMRIHTLSLGKLLELEDGEWDRMKREEGRGGKRGTGRRKSSQPGCLAFFNAGSKG